MNFAKRFIQKFATSIICLLSCFDRVIFKGYLPFRSEQFLNDYVDRVLGMRRKDFLPWLKMHSERLVEHGTKMALRQGRPYEYRQGRFKKEKFSQELIRKDGLDVGLVAVLCVQETCSAVKLKYGEGKPRLILTRRPQRVLYYYWLDANFGLMYLRLQTYFPYTMQVYVNGHDWSARQLTHWGLGFVQHDNAFVDLDHPQQAQETGRSVRQAPLGQTAQRLGAEDQSAAEGPRLAEGHELLLGDRAGGVFDRHPVRQPSEAVRIVPAAVESRRGEFFARDILTFLGRKLHGNFQGEVLTSLNKGRHPGARVKHWVKENWLKMYDKFGLILRVETVINQPGEFRVRRRCERNRQSQVLWCPMNKSVVNLPSYQRVARAANERYPEALSVVNDPAPAYQQMSHLTKSKKRKKRTYAGFNPARPDHAQLFRAVLSGDHLLRGFYNAQLRQALWGQHLSADQRRRQARQVTRLLKRLNLRGLLARIPHTRRWRVTALGQQVLGALVQLHCHGLATAL